MAHGVALLVEQVGLLEQGGSSAGVGDQLDQFPRMHERVLRGFTVAAEQLPLGLAERRAGIPMRSFVDKRISLVVREGCGVHVHGPHEVRPDFTLRQEPRGLALSMAAKHGHRLGVIPDGKLCRDPHPHLPIERLAEVAAIASEGLVGGARHDSRRGLHPLPRGYRRQPVGKHAPPPLQPRIGLQRLAVPVDKATAAESHADLRRLREGLLHPAIEPWLHPVILVQQVHEMAAGEFDAAIPVAADAESPHVGVDFNPARPIHRRHQLPHVGSLRAVIDDGDLHGFMCGRLFEHRVQRHSQLFARLKGRQHDGKSRTTAACVCSDLRNRLMQRKHGSLPPAAVLVGPNSRSFRIVGGEQYPLSRRPPTWYFPRHRRLGTRPQCGSRWSGMKIGSRIGDLLMAVPGLGTPVRVLRSVLTRNRRGYSAWVRRTDTPTRADLRQCRAKIATFSRQPTISIVMPVSDPTPAILDAAIRSVRDQVYPRWELCIAVATTAAPGSAAGIRRHAAADRRITARFHDRCGTISAASNTALEMASGDYVALFDPDGLLPPLALYWVVESINRHPDARILYSDEDKVDGHGRRFDPCFKGDFNHVLLLARNMIGHLGVYRRDLVVSLGGFREGFEGAQDHDLALRCVAAVSREEIVHVPRILYHRRAVAGSTALATTETPAATAAAQRAVAEHLRGFDSGATVEPAPESPIHLRIRHSIPSPAPLTSIVICTRDHEPLLRRAIDSIIGKTTYPHYEFVVLDNGSRDAATRAYLASISRRPGITVIRDESPFNYSRLNNTAIGHARGQVLCLLNDDIEVLSPGWLEEMVSFAVRPDVGAVGARLWYPDGTLQHGGVIVGLGGVAGHAHLGLAKGEHGSFCRAVLQQELSAVTGACLVVRRDVFEEVGGLDEQIAVAFNDVDLCLRIRAAGYRNIWTPFAELIHHESASRGQDNSPEKHARLQREIRFMKDRWGATLETDPYFNPNLSMHAGDYALPPRKRSMTRRRTA